MRPRLRSPKLSWAVLYLERATTSTNSSRVCARSSGPNVAARRRQRFSRPCQITSQRHAGEVESDLPGSRPQSRRVPWQPKRTPCGWVPAATAARLGLPPVPPPLPENRGLGEAISSTLDLKNDQSATDTGPEGGPEPAHGDTASVVVEAPDRDMTLVPREPSPVSPKVERSAEHGDRTRTPLLHQLRAHRSQVGRDGKAPLLRIARPHTDIGARARGYRQASSTKME